MQRVVCTAGTSLLTNAHRAISDTNLSASAAKLIQDFYRTLKTEVPQRNEFLAKLSAETNSLSRLNLNREDEVILLHTDTPDGKECAEALKEIIENEWKLAVRIMNVAGLQVKDPDRFRKEGIHNLFMILRKECVAWRQDNPEERQAILNVTGGFKAVVPYLTLFGLMHRLEVVYIFETSNSLIRLPPLPINFDHERLGQARQALQLLKKEGVLKKEEFFAAIPGLAYHERDWYESLLEEDAGNVTLSSVGLLLADAWEQDVKVVYLSPEARETYGKSEGRVRKQLDHCLTLLRDPLWRKTHLHRFPRTDLQVFKMAHQDERVAGFVRGDRLYVCMIYLSHDQYDRDLPTRRVADFESRLKDFQPWLPPAEEQISPTEAPDEYRFLVRENERLQKTVSDLERKLLDTEQCWQDAEKRCEELQSRCLELEQDRQKRDARINELQGQLGQLERQCRNLDDRNRQWETESQNLRQKLADVYRQLEDSQKRAEDLQRQLADSHDMYHHLQREKAGLEAKLRELEDQIVYLQNELSWARRPWWRKILGLPPVSPSTGET